MSEIMCSYTGDRETALVAAVYGDDDPAAQAAFERHVEACAQCRVELEALRGVRVGLARWTPPEPALDGAVFSRPSSVVRLQPPAGNLRSALRSLQFPAWAQVAAALLFLGVSAGIANLDVRYDATGFSVHTGWLKAAPPAAATTVAASGTDAPWRADLAALEQQMKNEIQAAEVSTAAARQAPAADADTVRRVRALMDESEKRQQRELALRVAEVLRDVNAQRQADLVKIERNLGTVQNNLGVEVMKQRQSLNLLYRASQRQEQ
jgi:hypothetical protein